MKVPSLRERREDVVLLAQHFLASAARELQVETKMLSKAAARHLENLPWQGNVRQLENTCRWLTVMASSNEVQVDDLPVELRGGSESDQSERDWVGALEQWVSMRLAAGEQGVLSEAVPAFEKTVIETALRYSGSKASRCA